LKIQGAILKSTISSSGFFILFPIIFLKSKYPFDSKL
jgi:hypothetical protein